MRPLGKIWLGLLLAAVGVFGAFPAANAAPSGPKFYDGSTTGHLEATGWFASYNGHFYGLLVNDDVKTSDRLFSSKIVRSAFSGSIFNPSNQAIGSFNGTLSKTGVAGKYTFAGAGGGTGDYAGTLVHQSAAGTRSFAGTYKVPALKAENVDVTFKLTRSGTFNGTAFSTSAGLRLKVATLTGRFLVDTNGHLWVLTLKAVVAKLPGNSIPIPKQGIPLKLGYQRVGRELRLVDSEDPANVLVTLVKK